jgi:large subunit ribosomal protein L4
MTTPEISRIDAAAYDAQGAERDRVFLPDSIFDGTVNTDVMHQAVKAFLSSQRQGTHATKTRGLVTGGNQKPWRQKGTGRARQGSTRAPHWPGGGTVFGPIPRGYTQAVPRKVKLLARKSAFNVRAREDAIVVIAELDFQEPKTSRIRALLGKLDAQSRNVLILTNGIKRNVYLSGRNLQNVMVLPFDDVSTYHLLWSHLIVVESPALGQSLDAAPARARKSRAAGAAAGEESGTDAPARSRPARSRGGARKKAASAGRKTASAKAKKTAARRAGTGSARKSPTRKTTAKRTAKPRRKGN